MMEITGVLFEVTASDTPRLNPIALLAGERLLQPPVSRRADATEGAAFRRRWYDSTLTLEFYSGGQPHGRIRPLYANAEDLGCDDLGGVARFEQPLMIKNARGLAAYWARAPHPARVVPATAAEDEGLLAEAQRILKARGFGSTHVERIVRSPAVALEATELHPRLLISDLQVESEAEEDTSVTGLLVGETRGDSVVYFLVLFDTGSGVDGARFEVVDILDVTGDGQPEIIVSATYWESGGYNILQRTPEGWREVFSGYAGGC